MNVRSYGSVLLLAVLCSVPVFAQEPPPTAVANDNRTSAGILADGTLTLHLEVNRCAWHPESEDGATLRVALFGESGKPAQVPGPLLRVPEGTNVHVTVANKLSKKTVTLFGMNTRPGDAKAGVPIAPGRSGDLNFVAGAPGTYFYWARTETDYPDKPPIFDDAMLSGAFIVDPKGPVPPDRVFMIGTMFGRADALSDGFEVVSLNGKSYPYTEPLEYTVGETIRWRVINPSFSDHPMHLHGSFFQLLSYGDYEKDTVYPAGEQQSMVTEDIAPQKTMMLEWKPSHAGRWLYHCHYHAHIAPDERVPYLLESSDVAHSAPAHVHDSGMASMHDMYGLVFAINVKPGPNPPHSQASSAPVHKLDLVIEPTAADAKMPTFACSVREGKKVAASGDKLMGPPIIVTRGEPAEITVLNHLKQPTTIHWHGIELDSYYDGVVGGGSGSQMTPIIEPGGSFVARFTPDRAGTFIYHTHAPSADQLVGGVYGPLIVLDPGEQYDPVHDKVLVVSALEDGFVPTHMVLNGTETPDPIRFTRGERYRLRLINMGSDLRVDVELGTKEHPATWHALAKDGASLPARLATDENANLLFASGETYDFIFQPAVSGEIPFTVTNVFSHAKVVARFLVQ